MAYVRDGRSLIAQAYARQFAMPAFNVCSLEMARACVIAAELERAPVILQTYPGDLEHLPAPVMTAMARALADEAGVPVLVHLDHGDSLQRVVGCLRAGYGSTMFDAAAQPLPENVARTRRIAEVVHAAGASLEAAAGTFEGGDSDEHLTDPESAAMLFEEAGADMVACSVGSRHGQPSRLDLDRLGAIAARVRKPLVLHGGSGIDPDDLAQAVRCGVVKVNIGAALQRALLTTWREHADADGHYPVYQAAREAIIAVAREKLRITNASGQAQPGLG